MNFGLKVGLVAGMLATSGLGLCRAEPVDLSQMTPGYSYYNRPGASPADHDAAVIACAAEALKVRSFDSQHSLSLGLAEIALADALAEASNRGAFAASLENCMVVRGWRVVRLSEAEGGALSKLAPAELSSRLSE